ncbi:MAG: hypothetical protein LIO41_04595 [Ruminococcus sp.]|nr:hypothetical protein [Ruminococcus sp.]
MSKTLFCPSCGHLLDNESEQVCVQCKITITPVETQHDFEYYQKIAKQHNPNCDIFDEAFALMNQEIAEYVKEHDSIYRPLRKKEHEINPPKYYKEEPVVQPKKDVPRCPICQSTKIQKISTVKRATHGITFGLFSKTTRSQFECKSGGYNF